MQKQNTGGRRVKTADTVFRVLEGLLELEQASMTELAEHLDLANSTVYGYLKTLEEKEYLVKEGSKYRIGLKFLQYGMSAQNHESVYRAATPVLDRLADETGDCVYLVVEEHEYGVCLDKRFGDRAVPTRGEVGERLHLHSNSSGKAILAHLPDEKVQRVIDRVGLPAQTESTITDPDQLFEELETIRDCGVSFNNGETTRGTRAVAAPITTDDGVQGAVTVIGPMSRFEEDRFRNELPELLKKAANEIELRLEFPHQDR